MKNEEKVKKLAELVKAFNDALTEAESFANEHKLSFSIYPAYGMGGRFGQRYDPWGDEDIEEGEWGWNPSSVGC